MTRDDFIKKYLGNTDYQYTDHDRDLMRDDLDKVIQYAESKNPIDFNKLRDEFFDECVDKRAFCEIGESFDRVVSLAPHDMFEWFKKKLTTKL